MENSDQKISKVSFASSNCSDSFSNDSIDYERTPQHSINPYQEDILNLISTLQLALNDHEISPLSNENPMETVKTLVSTICTEYLKATKSSADTSFSKTNSKDSRPSNFSAEPTGIPENVLEKLTNASSGEGTYINKHECKDLIALLVSLIRDSSNSLLHDKLKQQEITIVKSAKNINNLRLELKEKDLKITQLKQELEKCNLNKSTSKNAKSRYLDSESTLNESEDTII